MEFLSEGKITQMVPRTGQGMKSKYSYKLTSAGIPGVRLCHLVSDDATCFGVGKLELDLSPRFEI